MRPLATSSLQKNIRPIVWLVCGILFGGLSVAGLFWYKSSDYRSSNDCSKSFPYTNSTLDCNFDNVAARLHALDAKLNDAATLYVQEGKATHISIWVRDLHTGQWAASNENDTYSPASLMKLPLLITYYKVAEIEPSLLNTALVFKRSTVLNSSSQDFEPQSTLVPGASYAVKDLLTHMITYSDNDATAALLDHIDPTIFNNTLVDLGLKIPTDNNIIDFVTVKSYANILRLLYNATYLNRYYSEKALALLTTTNFSGLREPLPTGTPVADKFGEREVDNPDGSVKTRELHDCGIIYKNDTPYSICVMTEGKDFTALEDVINNVSRLVYYNL